MKKILFIEDEPALQHAIVQVLNDGGYQMFSAMDGQSGVVVAKKELPDLILLDLIIPKMDGFAVLNELKNDPRTKEIPVIVLTNLEGSADVERALTLGAKTYLVKINYQLDEILQKVKSIIGE